MLKNYTSQVSAARSIAFIESKLAQNGARQILKLYDTEGRVTGMCFMMKIDGREVPFKLPARIENCQKVLEENLSRRARPETRKKIPDQAERTAWKILSDWVEAQMAMIELAQIEVMEVFLPYVFDNTNKKTYFELLRENDFKALKALPAGRTDN